MIFLRNYFRAALQKHSLVFDFCLPNARDYLCDLFRTKPHKIQKAHLSKIFEKRRQNSRSRNFQTEKITKSPVNHNGRFLTNSLIFCDFEN